MSNESIISTKDVKQIAKAQIENMILDEMENEEEIGVKTSEELDDELSPELNFDVFEDIINPRIKKGERVSYSISVDNVQMATGITKLGSWSDIHKTYAPQGGFVLIKPRTAKGHWIKQQGLTFGKFSNASDEDESSSKDSNGLTMRDIMEMQARNDERHQQELAIARQEAKEASDEKLSLLTTILGNKKDDSSDSQMKFMMMMMEQSNKQQEQMRAESLRQEELRRQEKRDADERFEKLLLAMSGKEKEIDPVSEILRLQEAEDRGYNKAMQFNDLLEEKAESRALQLAEQNKEESVTDKALSTILTTLPHVAGVFANKAKQSSPNPVRNNPAPQLSSPVQNLGMEGISDDQSSIETSNNVVTINEEQKEREELQAKITNAKNIILDLTMSEIAGDLLAETAPEITSDKVIKILTDNNIDPTLVCKLFREEDFVQIANDNSLFELAGSEEKKNELLGWIKGFYNNVKTKTSAS